MGQKIRTFTTLLLNNLLDYDLLYKKSRTAAKIDEA